MRSWRNARQGVQKNGQRNIGVANKLAVQSKPLHTEDIQSSKPKGGENARRGKKGGAKRKKLGQCDESVSSA